MILPPIDSMSDEILMLWIMHRLADEFHEHAILKGGMQLMLYSSERATNDLDYVFVPYKSKKNIVPVLDKIFAELPKAKVDKVMHSTNGSYRIKVGRASAQLDFNVSEDVPSVSLSTELFARKLGQLPRIIRVMEPAVALANKLAAWNERRLIRDLYDIYYWYAIVGAMPDVGVLKERLAAINSQLPHMKKRKRMSLEDFLTELVSEVTELAEQAFLSELRSLVPDGMLNGIFPVFKAKIRELTVAIKI